MPIDTTPGTPGYLLQRLSRKLDDRLPRIEELFARYHGDPPLPTGAENAREAYRAFQRKARLNLAEMIVRAVRYRLRMVGVLTSAADGDSGDEEAWRIVTALGLNVEFPEAIRNMLVAGDGYMIVGRDPVDDAVIATAEDPRQVVTLHDPLRQSRVIAAAKFFYHPEEERDLAFLYTPGLVRCAYKDRRVQNPRYRPRFVGRSWDWDQSRGGADGLPLSGLEDVVPVVRFRNEEGVGEFETHVDVLDRINHMILQRMVVATLQAFKQRAIKVSPEDMPDEDEHGREIDYTDFFKADPGALWKLPETADIWESGAVDLSPILSSVKDDIQHLAATTFTPLSMFTPEGQNQSASGADLVREGQTSKVEDRQERIGQGASQVLSLVFRLRGDAERADPNDLQILWAPAQRYGLAEKYDAAVKAKAAGETWRSIMADVLQKTPQQIRRMESERMDDALLFQAIADATEPEPSAPPPAEG